MMRLDEACGVKPFMQQCILASASPRRVELLRQIGLKFEVRPSDIDERLMAGELAEDYVRRLAAEKARVQACEDHVVIAADTIVLIDQSILGKPDGRQQGLEMLMRLSGRSHAVMTGVAVTGPSGLITQSVLSTVRFKAFDRSFAERYWATGEPIDKAGSYGVQGLGAVFIEHLEGSYSNVMGLPLFETVQMLETMGVLII